METFTRLYPDTASGLTADDLAALVPGDAPDDRPFLLVNMIATADGRATIAGRAGPIANRADYELFHALRTRVDAVLVGAETVRVESYGPMEPAAVLVTRSMQRPARGRAAAGARTTGSSCSRLRPTASCRRPRRAWSTCATTSRAACGGCAPSSACARSCRRAARRSSASSLRAGLVDELHLVIAPKLAGGPDPLTIVTGAALDPPAGPAAANRARVRRLPVPALRRVGTPRPPRGRTASRRCGAARRSRPPR